MLLELLAGIEDVVTNVAETVVPICYGGGGSCSSSSKFSSCDDDYNDPENYYRALEKTYGKDYRTIDRVFKMFFPNEPIPQRASSKKPHKTDLDQFAEDFVNELMDMIDDNIDLFKTYSEQDFYDAVGRAGLEDRLKKTIAKSLL
jgi:hypothetical protein